MLKEFFDALTNHATKALVPNLGVYDDRRDVVYLEGGKMMFKPHTRGPVKTHQVSTIQSFCDIIKWARDNETTNNPAVFVTLNKVEFFYDSEDRQDCIVFDLPESEQYNLLRSVINRKNIQQKDLIRLLRIELAGTMDQQDALIAKLRQVKWSSEENMVSIVDKGKASLSKDMMKTFIGVDTLPDTVWFNVPLYESRFGTQAKLKFDLTPNEDNKQFVLTAYPGEFANAEAKAIDDVMAFITESLGEGFLVVAGTESES